MADEAFWEWIVDGLLTFDTEKYSARFSLHWFRSSSTSITGIWLIANGYLR
jgi:hypothetical protein